MNTLSSRWDGLHDSLLCHIRPIDYDGAFIGDTEVVAPVLAGGTLSSEFNWQSPFESMSPETKAPALSAMLQSGAVLPLVNATRDALSQASVPGSNSITGLLVDTLSSAATSAANHIYGAVRSLRGRTGVTKLNSEQIFNGIPPAKLALTLYFRAWSDPASEVMAPLTQLITWAHPEYLSPDGVLSGVITGSSRQGGILNSLLPSKAPNLLNIRFGGQVFQQMVIEGIEVPVTSPRDRNGNWTKVELPITFATLSGLDQRDIKGFFQGGKNAA